jgi:amino acid adenylation domain-containing protein
VGFQLTSIRGSETALDTGTDDLGPRLVAGVAVLLHRYTDRSTLAVGFAAEGGPSLALHLELAEDPSFSGLLGQAHRAFDDRRETGAMPTDGGDPEPDAIVKVDGGRAEVLLPHGGEWRALEASDPAIGHLKTILDGAAVDDSRSVSRLPILSQAEREQLLIEWNDTEADYPRRCLHELFEEQALRTPDAIAVQLGDRSLTYAELEQRANKLAHHLVALGVGRDVLVGICVERTVEMVVGLLAIVKAGGAYVPIDPAYPAERQAFMLTNSQAPVVITEERLVEALPVDGVHVVRIDADWPAIERLSDQPPGAPASPDQLAYVIYTSGSTGQPKGVQIPHSALVNFLTTMRDQPGLRADDVLVAVTTLSFDIAGLELHLPLTTGARVVLADGPTASDPRALSELLARSGATIMQATPTTWRMLVDFGWAPAPGLRALCGGEALPVALAGQLVELGVELWNMYGPTETTIWSTISRVQGGGRPLTIGRPIANTKLYILDKHLEPVPVGVAGELWIGGDGLARGYRGRPDLTSERFVTNPFDEDPESRMYRTGDLVRYRADGQVDYLGRMDHQVKVRGFRIELGEIETVLARHPAVASAVVVPRGTGAEAELAAYVIPLGVPVAAHALRQYLGQSLPSYMVPSTVTALGEFPLTPNGKVDRKALPEPTRERSGDHQLVAPRTDLERKLTDIWERELGIYPIGVTDNFFDLGVTSIVAATLFAAIEHELGNDLPLGAIFRAPTIESLAALLEQSSGKSRWTSLIPIQPDGSLPPIFCVHGGAGTILHLAALARRLGTDQPFYGLQSRGLYGGATPLQTVEEMASHYLEEMRQVHPPGPWRLAGYCFGTIVAFEMAKRLVAEGEDVELVAMFNGPSPIWIAKWGWYGNQPSFRERHPPAEQPTKQEHRRRTRASVLRRVRRSLREPRRAVNWVLWRTRASRTKVALALGRPVPEELREEYFMVLHAEAERAYVPTPYEGEILVFHGAGLYEEPSLGWEGLATGGVRTYAVPGAHDNNRQAMMEPAVQYVSEQLTEYLRRDRPPSLTGAATSAPAA